jgi:hypothetical protein
MAWRSAKSLTVFHGQLKAAHPRAAPPVTSPKAWGTIADTRHESTSDHAPHDFPGWGNDIVTAADWPHAPTLGLDAGQVAEALRVSHDPRIKYVIFGGRMFSSYPAHGYPAWTWRPYSGTDKHLTHGHLSAVGDPRADDTRPWAIGTTTTNPEGDDMGIWDDQPGNAIAFTLLNDAAGGAIHVRDALMKRAIDALDAKVTAGFAALKDRPVSALTPEDRAAIVADLVAAIAPAVVPLVVSAVRDGIDGATISAAQPLG